MHTTDFADEVVTHVGVHLSLLDRLRVLVHGRAHVLVRVETEHVVGATRGTSSVSIPPVIPPKPPQGQAEAIGPHPGCHRGEPHPDPCRVCDGLRAGT